MNAQSPFSHQLRLRVCGLLVEEDTILLANIHSPVIDQLVWMPPGGGVEYGESMAASLKREFREETELSVTVDQLLHVQELIEEPFHAVECYFEVNRTGGEPAVGSDPELSNEEQLIEEVAWIPISKLEEISFAPQNLLPKLKHWKDRSDFEIFTH